MVTSSDDNPAGEDCTTKCDDPAVEEEQLEATPVESNLKHYEDTPDLKVILVGDSAVGKSKLVERFLQDEYTPQRLSTYALTMYRKNIKLGDGTNVKTEIWDTAGQEKFSSLHSSYYFNADVCIMVFDITRKQTYLNLKTWYSELRKHCENIPCIVVANKVDIDYAVTRKKFNFAAANNLPLFYVSSADGTNVVKVIEEAVCAGLGHKRFGGKDFVQEVLELFEESIFLE